MGREGGEIRLKIAVLVIAVALLGAAILAIPLVGAIPLKEKNNDKFQAFHVVATYNWILSVMGSDNEYVPSEEKVNKCIQTVDEEFMTYEITVGTHTYTLGDDFAYSGLFVTTYWDPVFGYPYPVSSYPMSERASQSRVDYTYDFSAVLGGLDGVLQLRCVANNGGMVINSLVGTGDFQNVQIKAIATSVYDPARYTVYIFHEGSVSGWPE